MNDRAHRGYQNNEEAEGVCSGMFRLEVRVVSAYAVVRI